MKLSHFFIFISTAVLSHNAFAHDLHILPIEEVDSPIAAPQPPTPEQPADGVPPNYSDRMILDEHSLRVGAFQSGVKLLDGDQKLKLSHGVELGLRIYMDGVGFNANWRLQVGVGQSGLDYAYLNLRGLRLRFALDEKQRFFVAFAPIDLDAVGTTKMSPLRGRFGYRPGVMFGAVQRVGKKNCVMQFFATPVAAMFGWHESQTNQKVHFLNGAEVLIHCPYMTIDTTYTHLYSNRVRNDVDRVDADIFGQIPWKRENKRDWDLGPYLNGQFSHERTDRSQGDQFYYILSTGVRGYWGKNKSSAK